MRHIICFHKPEEENGYLSNWYPSPFEKGGISFANMEQYMMYRKALQFRDIEIAQKILQNNSPGVIKALGRSVRNYVDSQWSAVRQQIVYEGLLEKFRQNQSLLQDLLETAPHILAECAVNDRIWGIGLSMTDSSRFSPEKWRGQNLLGYTLMQVRDELSK
ncbi:NADAR family protein [Ruminococcus sp.]|jgi:ribA/ribD-fused uncharacterized protein|uniref:NADAR family protein n=1 Tax=Ruminococcus sp. TaxID=41978 RepID=UPI0026194BE2|nr:NADAR family protein [Ruminococcus sp.]MEE0023813.1 NADAR family protein [Ruminococcus sp.]